MKKLFGILSIILASGCASYSITKESLTEQIGNSQDPSIVRNASSIGTAYTSNHLSQIKCVDKAGHEVIIDPNKNTTFAITKTDGKKVTFYYDTVTIFKDTLYGLGSRIVGGKKRVSLAEIFNIKVQTEQQPRRLGNAHISVNFNSKS